MKKTDLLQSERPTRGIALTDDEKSDAIQKAKADHSANGTDANTRDPENIMNGRIRGVAGEIAFVKYAKQTFGTDAVTWVAGDDGEKEPYDVIVNGVRIDVQTRNDAQDYDNYALLKQKNVADNKQELDVYVCVVTDPDVRRFVLWGYAERDRLHNRQQIDTWRFDTPTYYLDDLSPYFKDANELERRLSPGK